METVASIHPFYTAISLKILIRDHTWAHDVSSCTYHHRRNIGTYRLRGVEEKKKKKLES